VTLNKYLYLSIKHGLDHRKSALDHAPDGDVAWRDSKADTFVGMYANDWTLDFGDRGREAVRQLLKRGYESGVITKLVEPEFVDPPTDVRIWRRMGGALLRAAFPFDLTR
jgi:1,4-dihydroxy-6-naphthoate synthase